MRIDYVRRHGHLQTYGRSYDRRGCHTCTDGDKEYDVVFTQIPTMPCDYLLVHQKSNQ